MGDEVVSQGCGLFTSGQLNWANNNTTINPGPTISAILLEAEWTPDEDMETVYDAVAYDWVSDVIWYEPSNSTWKMDNNLNYGGAGSFVTNYRAGSTSVPSEGAQADWPRVINRTVEYEASTGTHSLKRATPLAGLGRQPTVLREECPLKSKVLGTCCCFGVSRVRR